MRQWKKNRNLSHCYTNTPNKISLSLSLSLSQYNQVHCQALYLEGISLLKHPSILYHIAPITSTVSYLVLVSSYFSFGVLCLFFRCHLGWVVEFLLTLIRQKKLSYFLSRFFSPFLKII
ncbi:hypothetical protein U1Q18_038391 [Sarracenia purpurea var. burkii]